MSAPRISIALLALLAAAALAGCGSSSPATYQQQPSSVTSPIGGQENGASSGGVANAAGGSAAASDPTLLGQEIFQTGNAPDGSAIPVTAGAGGPCARCHGPNAEGMVGPDIRWSVLTGATSSAHGPRFKLGGVAQFGTAITTGVAAGNTLKPLMPHYRLTADQISALAAYLKTQ